MMSNLVGIEADPKRIRCDMPVEVVYEKLTDEITLPAVQARGRLPMKELRNSVCIVGVDESDEIGTLPNKSQLTLHLEAVRNAVRDAGLKVQ